MVLGVDELLKRVKKDHLVTGLSERELTNPEGAGFDLRLGKVHRISGKAYLGIQKRKTVNAETIMEYDPKKTQVLRLIPGKQVLVTTMEKVKLPANLTMNMQLRSTLYRSGIVMSGGNTAPGYEGELSFTLFNCGKSSAEIELGARIVHAQFLEVRGKTSMYRGQWKGGRVVTKKMEKQV